MGDAGQYTTPPAAASDPASAPAAPVPAGAQDPAPRQRSVSKVWLLALVVVIFGCIWSYEKDGQSELQKFFARHRPTGVTGISAKGRSWSMGKFMPDSLSNYFSLNLSAEVGNSNDLKFEGAMSEKDLKAHELDVMQKKNEAEKERLAACVQCTQGGGDCRIAADASEFSCIKPVAVSSAGVCGECKPTGSSRTAAIAAVACVRRLVSPDARGVLSVAEAIALGDGDKNQVWAGSEVLASAKSLLKSPARANDVSAVERALGIGC